METETEMEPESEETEKMEPTDKRKKNVCRN